jgi:GT2 family glycosyltransferase/ubiquinone/menaquinone biosynthesis C-methylase UbiE/glycosyltransferase involved in cell wall biosynthesis
MARPTLYRALASLALQQGEDIEIVVVDATGGSHPALDGRCGPHPLTLVQPGRALPRADAANVAMAQARGRWVLFVDDDDAIDPQHVARLREALAADPGAAAAYAGVQLLGPDGTPAGVLDEPFDLVRLHCENYLPIHAVMFSREAAGPAPWFDESLAVYEDWDFWLRLAQGHRFVHVPGVSATYHLVGESGVSSQCDAEVTLQGRRAVYAKWAGTLAPAMLDAMARRAETGRVRTQALQAECARLGEALHAQAESLQQAEASRDSAEEGVQWLKEQQELAHAQAAEAQRLLLEGQRLLHDAQSREQEAQARWQAGEAALQATRAQLDALQDEWQQQRTHQLRTLVDLEQACSAAMQKAEDALQLRDAAQQNAETQRQRAAEVRAELQVALRSYRQLEAGYGQVTQSLSWRMTEPLRKVRSLLCCQGGASPARKLVRALVKRLPVSGEQKQRIKVWVVARPWAARWLPWLAISSSVAVAAGPRSPVLPQGEGAAPGPGTVATPRPVGGVDKEAVRAEAETELTRFLQGQERIALRAAAPQPEVSVIVVLFNQAGLSLLCLRALAQSWGVSFETLIVDNASHDRTPQLLARVDGATVLPQAENLGFLRAVNQAAAHARGQHLLLLNNDALVEPGTLLCAVQRLAREPDAGAVGGPILLWNGRLQEAGSIIWRDGSCLGYGRGQDPDDPAFRFVRDVDYCSGALLMVRRELFEGLGRFDEVYAPAYYEESDFCVRLWEGGHRVVYDPAVRVKHFEFASDLGSGRSIELQRRNRALFVPRHASFLAGQLEPAADHVLQARQRLRAGKQRILMIDDRVPLPWLGQGYPRAAEIVQVLVRDGHFVTHYPLQFPHEPPEYIAKALPETVEVMVGRGLAGLSTFLAERAGFYDVVVVSRPHNMEVLTAVAAAQPAWLQGTRVVYDAEALFSLRDIAKAEVLGQPLASREQQQRVAAETALARRADAIVTVSELEASHYRDAGYADVHILGHSMPLRPTAPPFEARCGFLFVGALLADDTPNTDSVLWFVREVWPQVVTALGPRAQLSLVGPCEAPAVLALAGMSVRIEGPAQDLSGHFASARVFVVPTRYAAGIAHKAHEAAAYGLPMVASALIAGQLGWDEVVAVGRDAAAFAQACITLHEDPARWRQARERALAAVKRDCAPERFRDAVLAAVAGASAPALPPGPQPVPELPVALPPADEAPSPHVRRLADLRALLREQAAAPRAAAASNEDRTANHWGQDAQARLNQLNALRHWASHPVTAAQINIAVSGDSQVGWIHHLKRAYFARPGRRGLSLGCGSGAAVVDAVMLDVVQQMEGLDISPGAVEVAQRRANEAGVGTRASFAVADLNHPSLQGLYELVIFEQSLHHIGRLGPVLDECARVLAPSGLFVINEYVGPDRFQWNDTVDRSMNELLQSLPEKYRIEPLTGQLRNRVARVSAEQVIAVDPSEAVHSSEILAACAARFDVVEMREFGGTLLQFALAEIIANFDPEDAEDAERLRTLVWRERELIKSGEIGSDFVFAVYRKREPAPTVAMP